MAFSHWISQIVGRHTLVSSAACLLLLSVVPASTGNDATQLKERIAELEVQVDAQRQIITSYENQIVRLENKCQALTRENLRYKALCRTHGIPIKPVTRDGNPEPILLKAALHEVGWIGEVDLVEVLGPTSALIKTRLLSPKGSPVPMPQDVRSLKLLTPDHYTSGCVYITQQGHTKLVYGRWLTQPKSLLLRGIDTTRYADSMKIEINRYCEITGTERRGSRTFFVLEPLK